MNQISKTIKSIGTFFIDLTQTDDSDFTNDSYKCDVSIKQELHQEPIKIDLSTHEIEVLPNNDIPLGGLRMVEDNMLSFHEMNDIVGEDEVNDNLYNLSEQEVVVDTNPREQVNQKFDPKTGHLTSCARKGEAGLNKLPVKIKGRCPHYTENDEKCPSILLSLLSCNGPMCNIERKNQFDVIENWDRHLSDCANTLCDEKNMSLAERKQINHKTIKQILGIPGDLKYNHISNARRKKTNKINKDKKEKEIKKREKMMKKNKVINKKIDLTNNGCEIESSKNDFLDEFINKNITGKQIRKQIKYVSSLESEDDYDDTSDSLTSSSHNSSSSDNSFTYSEDDTENDSEDDFDDSENGDIIDSPPKLAQKQKYSFINDINNQPFKKPKTLSYDILGTGFPSLGSTNEDELNDF